MPPTRSGFERLRASSRTNGGSSGDRPVGRQRCGPSRLAAATDPSNLRRASTEAACGCRRVLQLRRRGSDPRRRPPVRARARPPGTTPPFPQRRQCEQRAPDLPLVPGAHPGRETRNVVIGQHPRRPSFRWVRSLRPLDDLTQRAGLERGEREREVERQVELVDAGAIERRVTPRRSPTPSPFESAKQRR